MRHELVCTWETSGATKLWLLVAEQRKHDPAGRCSIEDYTGYGEGVGGCVAAFVLGFAHRYRRVTGISSASP
jgi:hypothetical protein